MDTDPVASAVQAFGFLLVCSFFSYKYSKKACLGFAFLNCLCPSMPMFAMTCTQMVDTASLSGSLGLHQVCVLCKEICPIWCRVVMRQRQAP